MKALRVFASLFVTVAFLMSAYTLAQGKEKGPAAGRGAAPQGRIETRELNADLMRAATYGDMSAAQTALDRGADINGSDVEGMTALMQAARSGQSDMLIYLLESGADVNQQDTNGATALLFASWAGKPGIVQTLLQHGAHISSGAGGPTPPQKKGLTPLMMACIGGNYDVAKLLIQQKCDVNARDEDGESALLYSIKDGRLNLVKLLLKNGARINSKDAYGRTPLMIATIYGHEDVAEYLLAHGANPDTKDDQGLDAAKYAWALDRDAIRQMLGGLSDVDRK
ncbi:MAG: ankyrin repeat domain-containing protein [Syntrophobacteraceae bacterium]